MSFDLKSWLSGFVPAVGGLPQPVVGGGEDKKLSVLGWLMGRQVMLRGAGAEQEPGEPVAYLYNEVRLPPPATNAAYKAILKHKQTDDYVCVACVFKLKYVRWIEGDTALYYSENYSTWQVLNQATGEWVNKGELNGDYLPVITLDGVNYWHFSAYDYVWSNFTITDPDDSSVIIYEGTKPVPVYG
ncbi:MAG: hypothetical protein IJ960_00935 [Oscillospiraceae bacterium]|nr:hypothetical protein [Oscillospiraceae bacterium]